MSVAATYAGADARPAGFWIILGVVQFVAMFAVGVSADPESVNGRGLIAIVQLSAWALAFVYVIGFVAAKGATPGKMALGLRVVRQDGAEPVGFGAAFMREVLGKLVSSLVLGIGYLMVGFRGDKRGLHDLIARTSVVKG